MRMWLCMCNIGNKNPNWKYINNCHRLHLPLPGYMIVNSSAKGIQWCSLWWCKLTAFLTQKCNVKRDQRVQGDGGVLEFRPSNRKQPNSLQNVYQTAPAGSQQINRMKCSDSGGGRESLFLKVQCIKGEREREKKGWEEREKKMSERERRERGGEREKRWSRWRRGERERIGRGEREAERRVERCGERWERERWKVCREREM